jgi:hypothetical protein
MAYEAKGDKTQALSELQTFVQNPLAPQALRDLATAAIKALNP